MNLADPELELIDPTPNVHSLFVHFDELFFNTKLCGRALVRWSKRMYSCAGVCSYEGRNGICDIALSEPLLKLRPRKDLIETLLHEMIHAYLFITNMDRDRDGHGPNFQAHMHRINKHAGLNISIYHDFHDEVKLYLKHWWRCNGICQKWKPYFGVVRRSSNRAPGPNDTWWEAHRRQCAGAFIKIKEPPPKQKPTKSNVKGKINANITKYVITKNNTTGNNTAKNNTTGNNTAKKNTTVNVNKENKMVNSVKVIPDKKISPATPQANAGNCANKIDDKRRNSSSVIEKVRDVWANKQINKVGISKAPAETIRPQIASTTKHKAVSVHTESPPSKIKKIDNYFKSTASSILKDVYGKEFIISQSSNNKLKAVTVEEGNGSDKMNVGNITEDLVNCPNCNARVNSTNINSHLDECLNKAIIETLRKEFVQTPPITTTNIQTNEDKRKLKDSVGDIPRVSTNISKKEKTDLGILKTKDYTDIFKITEPSASKEDCAVQICPGCGNKVDKPIESHLNGCLGFFNNNVTIPEEGTSMTKTLEDEANTFNIKVEPGTSKEVQIVQRCPCCGDTITKPIEFHLDECLGFFNNDSTLPTEGANSIETIIIDDDDDEFDETQTLNATGTKTPCPCCLKMVEIEEMNDHLDICIFKT